MLSRLILFAAICLYSFVQLNARVVLKNDQTTEFSVSNVYSSKDHKQSNDKFNEIQRSNVRNLKKELLKVEFEIDNEAVLLNLTPLDHNVYSLNTFVWTIEPSHNTQTSRVYKNVDNAQLKGQFYKDFENKAVVYKTGDYYDGVVGEGRKQKNIHSKLGKSHLRNINNEATSNSKINKITSIDSLVVDNDFVHFDPANKYLDTLYPRLLLVVEWNYFKMFGENINNLIKYLSLFWNAVNLKYAEISSPKINIIISGIVISKDNAALDFFTNSRDKKDPSKLNHLKLLSLGNEFFQITFKKETDFRDYDAAVLMTNSEAGSVKGSTMRGQICKKNLIYVSDDAKFGSVLSATHELGHSLGLSHDNRTSVTAVSSSVMGPYLRSPDEYFWSENSLNQIQAFAMTKQAKCLED